MSNRWIREFLSFSRKERNGIIGLLLIIFLLIITGELIPFFIPPQTSDFSKWEGEVSTYLRQTEKKMTPVEKELTLFPFDPNNIDSLSLIQMGLPEKVVANWVRYLRKGGKFRDKEGVKKIFGMTESFSDQLDSFMLFTSETHRDFKVVSKKSLFKEDKAFKRDTFAHQIFVKKEKHPVAALELNSADSVQLLQIPGIGSVLSSRIIRYRNLLGGFYVLSQLREVYGLNDVNYPVVSTCLTVDPSTVKTFNINFSTLKEMGHHPYIGYKTARKLLRLRDQKGKFQIPEDLSPVVTSDSLKRLTPYLKFSL